MTPHGGKREGAGRNYDGEAPRVRLSVMVDPSTKKKIENESEQKNISQGKVVDERFEE